MDQSLRAGFLKNPQFNLKSLIKTEGDKMNIKQQLESRLSEIYYSNSGDDYDEYLNVENDAEEILQSILKAIMGKAKQLKKEHGEFCSNDHRYNTVLEEFESVIKEILDAEPKKGTKNLDALDATNQNK